MTAVAAQWCPWCGNHMGAGGWVMMIGWWLIVLLVLGAVLWAVFRGGGFGAGGGVRGKGPAEDVLRQRYARGEIDEETYRRMLDELRRG